MGFIAGTLVHTDKGLVPIQDLKIGDLVLSMPIYTIPKVIKDEEAHIVTNFQTYCKPIQNIFKLKKQELISPLAGLICNDIQQFWTEKKHWRRCFLIDANHKVFQIRPPAIDFAPNDFNDWSRVGMDKMYLFETPFENLAVSFGTNFGERNFLRGCDPYLIDFAKDEHISYQVNDKQNPFVCYPLKGSQPLQNRPTNEEKIRYEQALTDVVESQYHLHPIYKGTIYTVEIEDYHTYFVGEQGFWVHQ